MLESMPKVKPLATSCSGGLGVRNGRTVDKVEYDSLQRAFSLVVDRARISGANVHSWRKTYAMDRAIDGADILDLLAELRHKDVETSRGYIDLHLVTEMREKRLMTQNGHIGQKQGLDKTENSDRIQHSQGFLPTPTIGVRV